MKASRGKLFLWLAWNTFGIVKNRYFKGIRPFTFIPVNRLKPISRPFYSRIFLYCHNFLKEPQNPNLRTCILLQLDIELSGISLCHPNRYNDCVCAWLLIFVIKFNTDEDKRHYVLLRFEYPVYKFRCVIFLDAQKLSNIF